MPRIELLAWREARAQAVPIRFTVFVEEQGVPQDIELDDKDDASLHAVVYEGAEAVATGRLLPDGHVGRMAVLKKWRRRGVGGAMLTALVEAAARHGHASVVLSAQTHAVPFYRAHGFVAQGGEYVEAGIPHQEMALPLGRMLLAEAARLAVEIAPRECLRGPWGEHCMAMHAAWPALRLIGHVGGPAQDAALFGRAVGLLGSARPDVLISGASDYAILEQLLLAAGPARALGAITVLDRCDTPLALNRWYAERVGRAIETRRSDIVEFAPGQTYDAIFAHSFLEHLPRGRWGDLARRWQALLRPGGVLAAVFRVRSEQEAAADVGTRREAADFLPFLEKTNATLPPRLQLPSQEIAGRIAQHWRTRITSPVRSTEEVLGLLTAAGLQIQEAESAAASVAARPGLPSSKRVRLIARRPA